MDRQACNNSAAYLFLPQVAPILTNYGFHAGCHPPRFNLVGKWLGKYRNITTEEPWYILTSLIDIQAAVDAYAKRFGIEEMFRDFKRGGYNLERTNLTGERLSKLLILLSLAYLKSIIQGIEIKSKQVQEYLSRKTESNRKYARHSTFYIGLWGES